MKYCIILCLLLSFSPIHSQEDINSLVEKGIILHDEGKFEEAIETYKKALEIDPKSSLVNYEISLSYFYNKDYQKAIKHCDIVLKNKDQHQKEAYITKGSSLDNLGKTKASIKLFKKAIKDYEDVLLYYNLALNYYKQEDFENAEEIVTKGIALDSSHSSSHLILAYINYNNNKRTQSLLNLHYFLFLEPNSRRSPEAGKLIQEMMRSNVSQDPDKPNTINISLVFPGEDNEFRSAEMMLSLLEASKMTEKNKDKTEDELFIDNTRSFFNILGELNSDEKKSIYWDIYIPFFYNIAQSEHMDAYCYYVMQSVNPYATAWFEVNKDQLDAFDAWFNKQYAND
ncbi:MAG: tetratricopeptide repeat protein [Psychroserpens sp.]|nr:tetratricopeptide repeat protein [Psychroserpens sp.]